MPPLMTRPPLQRNLPRHSRLQKLLRFLSRDVWRRGQRSRWNFIHLNLEQLEELTLLSGSIAGNVWNDGNGDGVRAGNEPSLAGQIAYLDLNHDGRLDSSVNTFTKSAPVLKNLGGIFVSALHVANVPTTTQDVAVTLDLVNTSSDPVPIVLLSPTGLSSVLGTGDILQGPYVFTIQPGQHFVGTFDGASTNPVTQAALPVANGTYAPQESFSTPQTFVDGVNPNGVWGLLFLPPSGSSAGLTLNSWSLALTQPEPSTTTDAAGNYAFQGLDAGSYSVNLVVPGSTNVTSPGGASQTVTVVDGQTVGGVNFGLQPLPDLTGTSFTLTAPATTWGQKVTIDYTLTNRGAGAAGAFDAGVYLSSSGLIDSTEPLLDTLHFNGLAAGASSSGSVTVALPAQAPGGFGSLSTAYAGLVIDPAHALAESDTANNSNQGAGIDRALLGPQLNQAVSSGASVQQNPTIVADPTNPNHLATAYMDYGLVKTGYAGIGIAVSQDGGKTWTNSSVPLPAGFDQGAAAPSLAFDAQGNLFVSFMAATFLGAQPSLTNPSSGGGRQDGFQSNNGIFVAESGKASGGLSWSQPVAVTSHLYTGTATLAPTADPAAVPFDAYPALAIDTSPTSPNFGNLYVTWTRFYPGAAAAPQNQYPGGDPTSNTGGSDVMIAASLAGGASWTTEAPAGISAIRDPFDGPTGGTAPAGNGFVKFSSVTLGPDGSVYVATDTGGFFTVYASKDGAQSFTAPLAGGLGGNYLGNPFDYTQTGVLPDPTLDNFTTFRTRAIAADPTRPGVLYAIAPSGLAEAQAEPGNLVAANGIVFAVSTDYGASWTSNFTVGNDGTPAAQLTPDQINSGYEPILNDENGGQYPGFAPSLATQVVASQAFPSISVSPQGTITVIWYDTRSDPAGAQLEVWGTASSDGGQHFSANFPISNASFDPNGGAFTDAAGKTDYSLGTQIGVVAAGGSAYAVWTDTRNGGQQIFGGGFSLSVLPAAPVDRFAPDFTQATAANLGVVTAAQGLPKLSLLPGQDDEWFSLQAGASGELSVSVAASSGGSNLHVELTDGNGKVLPTTLTNVLDASGAVIGQALVAASVSGQNYFIHVFGSSDAGITYTLNAGTLTADFGSQVEGTTTATVAMGGLNDYRLVAGLAGTLQVTLAGGGDVQGNLNLTLLGADGQTALASDPAAGVGAGQSEQLTITVSAGQVVFLQVSGANLTSPSAGFTLQFTNLDQYEAPALSTLFLPTTGTPSALAVADLNNNGKLDLIASHTTGSDTVSVLTANGDGTFQPEKQSDVGVGLSQALIPGSRPIAVADLNGDSTPDLIVPNFTSDDISVLLGNGNGTFQPQRRFDAVANPTGMVTGDFNGDGHTDVVLRQSFSQTGPTQLVILFGRGDGTFLPPVYLPTAFSGAGADGPLVAGDFGNGHLDIVLFNNNQATAQIFFGNGDGTFGGTLDPATGKYTGPGKVFATGEPAIAAAAADLGNGKLDLITTGTNTGNVYVMLGNGDGTFAAPAAYQALAPRPGDNVTINGLVVTNFQSGANGALNIVVTAAPRSAPGAAEVIMLPGNGDGTFGAPVVLAKVGAAGSIVAGNFGSGGTDLAVADNGGITVIYSTPLTLAPNATPQTARNLGDTAHLLTQPQGIVAAHEDAYYTYQVPIEAVPGSGAEIVDFSALFQDVGGAGLQMEILDAKGNVLGSGPRQRLVLPQGEQITIHIFGVSVPSGAAGFGSYTLDVDVLPQVVSVVAQSALPGAPATSIVLTLQGDRLDPATAENANNYTVTWLGPNGQTQVIPIAAVDGAQPIVYDPGANINVADGLTYPTSVRQTITLLFAAPLPAGSYQIALAPSIQTAPMNSTEAAQLAANVSFDDHPLVSLASGAIENGSVVVAANLVAPGGAPGDLGLLTGGTAFFTQLQNDLSAMLDSLLRKMGDDPSIGPDIMNEILARVLPGLEVNGQTPIPLLLLWLDPVSLNLTDSAGARTVYNEQSNAVANTQQRTVVEVGGNVELVVVAGASGNFALNVGDVGASSRGGAAVVAGGTTQVTSLTSALRAGLDNFDFVIPTLTVALAGVLTSTTPQAGAFAAAEGAVSATGVSADASSSAGVSSAVAGEAVGAAAPTIAFAAVGAVGAVAGPNGFYLPNGAGALGPQAASAGAAGPDTSLFGVGGDDPRGNPELAQLLGDPFWLDEVARRVTNFNWSDLRWLRPAAPRRPGNRNQSELRPPASGGTGASLIIPAAFPAIAPPPMLRPTAPSNFSPPMDDALPALPAEKEAHNMEGSRSRRAPVRKGPAARLSAAVASVALAAHFWLTHPRRKRAEESAAEPRL
jgi:hypothetical protein